MTDRQGDQDPEPTPPTSPTSPTDAVELSTEGPPSADARQDRRAFLRRLPNDAVWTAGKLAGLSSVVRRSVVAAGGAAVRDLAPASVDELATSSTALEAGLIVPAASAATNATAVPAAASTTAAPPASSVSLAPPALPAPDPVLSLTPEQHDFLANGAQAALAVNDLAGAPHLTSSIYRWDGATFRLPGEASTARALHIDRDPRVSLLVEDPLSEAWVAITGVASLRYEDVERETLLVLAKYLSDDAAHRRWEEMRLGGIPIVIQVRPTRFVWRSA